METGRLSLLRDSVRLVPVSGNRWHVDWRPVRPAPPDQAGALTPSTHNPKGSRCRFVASPCSPLAVSPPVCPPPSATSSSATRRSLPRSRSSPTSTATTACSPVTTSSSTKRAARTPASCATSAGPRSATPASSSPTPRTSSSAAWWPRASTRWSSPRSSCARTALTSCTPSAGTIPTPPLQIWPPTFTSTTTSSLSSACPRPLITTSFRSASRWAPGRPPRRAPASPSTSSGSTAPTRACSSFTSAWAATAAT